MIDKRPAVIAYCASVRDVVEFGRFRACDRPPHRRSRRRAQYRRRLGLRWRPGYRSVAHELRDGGPKSPRPRAHEGGALLADLDAATQVHGLATPTGLNSDTGLIGLTLGGGIGRLARKHGLSCDNMLSAQIVTADGRVLHVSQDENADLFWGLRGGGGNFGVVTAITYRLHALGPIALAGSLDYGWRQARDALRRYAEFSVSAPDEVYADAALFTRPDGEPGVTISTFYAGPIGDGELALRPLREGLTPIADRIGPTPYVELQKAADANFPHGERFYWKAQFLREIMDAAIDALIERFPAAPSNRSLFVFQQVGGAIARTPTAATAYANRSATHDCFPVSKWTDPSADEANIAWARDMYAAMQPFALDGVYVNNLGDEGEDRVRAAYGANYDRLVALKRQYDPEKFLPFESEYSRRAIAILVQADRGRHDGGSGAPRLRRTSAPASRSSAGPRPSRRPWPSPAPRDP